MVPDEPPKALSRRLNKPRLEDQEVHPCLLKGTSCFALAGLKYPPDSLTRLESLADPDRRSKADNGRPRREETVKPKAQAFRDVPVSEKSP